ncbi:glycoside hydrolase family 20 zincin-like fold domain-containing protein [Ruania zhangjianzhongii]|uniref:glycoside hydrolase family 20 zincin-like fold domain-containing protein n=1 Tax=Ruania zhangjianzhongii TaxID=2603206 RepID=UPI0011C840D9|nr:glycoside hydrolase family 20 zincin-like fold domain-containing protein [Ruania zhangjianzhongii]
MIDIFPEPQQIRDDDQVTVEIETIALSHDSLPDVSAAEISAIVTERLADHADVTGSGYRLRIVAFDPAAWDVDQAKLELFAQQGYVLEITESATTLHTGTRAGLVHGLSTLKVIADYTRTHHPGRTALQLPQCQVVDYPDVPVRAVAPTFSWYAGYGRMGFDMQLWGLEDWKAYIRTCLDGKINQLNMVMYGYWPFALEGYPETVYQDIPMKVWAKEVNRFLDIKFSHPNIAADFLPELLEYAHTYGVKLFAYVGLNSYNGGWTIAHPEKRMIPPVGSGFLNDFDSACLSDPETVDYILAAMRRIAELGFDGYALEESEEGFWFCQCDRCQARWGGQNVSPGEAKHAANLDLLHQIYREVRSVKADIVVGIRAFRQPPLEKDPQWLREVAETIPDDVVLFWAPGLYVPEAEFTKWVEAFGAHRIWGRDTESNSITSTMGRLYRTFESNLLRYSDEANVQTIERDIEQHVGSVQHGVHGVNGYMFEWAGLFMHQWAHANYAWGSRMDQAEFFSRVCRAQFGTDLGDRVLAILQGMLTIHESQLALYTTPFPFQSNVLAEGDRPAIRRAIEAHPSLLASIEAVESELRAEARLSRWVPHFERLRNAQRRNRVIYDMALTSLDYEQGEDPERKRELLHRILELNEADFDIVKEMFFDILPVNFTGVKSSMYPYHELNRLIGNVLHPEATDDSVVSSGIEALGWLWLEGEKA